MNKNSFYSRDELAAIGWNQLGERVLVSRHARIYNPENIMLGDDIRIDDFVTLSAGQSGYINLHGHNHISVGVQLFGASGLSVGRHSQISMQAIVLTQSDDPSGEYLVGPTYERAKRRLDAAPVNIEEYCWVCVRATIMPGVTLHEGSILAAHSFAKENIPPWEIHGGVPARFIGHRSDKCKTL